MGGIHRLEIGIRDATDADLVSIVAIVNREIAESPFVWGETPTTVPARREWLAQHRERRQPVLVATESADHAGRARVIGWASLSTFRPASGYRLVNEASVYVAREAQRAGVGRRLVTALHAAGSDMGLRAIVAVIDTENLASIELFRSLGYQEAGRLDEIGLKFGQWRSEVFLLKHLTGRW